MPAHQDFPREEPRQTEGPKEFRRSFGVLPRKTPLWLKIASVPVYLFAGFAAIALLVTFTKAVNSAFDIQASSDSVVRTVMSYAPTSEVFSGRVTKVVDGDTLYLRVDGNQHVIRLHEIDAPELGQPWGWQARRALSNKVSRKNVVVEVSTTDAYGRLVGKVWLGERDINRVMVWEGHAWAYRQYLNNRLLLKYEASAKKEGIGLWSQADPIPPWEWRKRQQRRKDLARTHR